MHTIAYNTTEEQLTLPQYGRLVQNMIDHALTIAGKNERQAYAEHIIKVMALLNPQMKTSPNYMQTLWNHMAFMAGYRLDIDYPCAIEVRENRAHPCKLSYPGNRIRYRHYGHLVEQALEKLREMPANGAGRDDLVRMTALRMKRYLADWKGDGIENDKVGRDMEMYTDGKVTVDEAVCQLEMLEERPRNASTIARYNNRRYHR